MIVPPQATILDDFCHHSLLPMDAKALCRDARMHAKQEQRTNRQLFLDLAFCRQWPKNLTLIVGIRYGKFSGHCLQNTDRNCGSRKSNEKCHMIFHSITHTLGRRLGDSGYPSLGAWVLWEHALITATFKIKTVLYCDPDQTELPHLCMYCL